MKKLAALVLLTVGSAVQASDTPKATSPFDPAVSIKDDTGFIPRMKSLDGQSQSYGRLLRMPPGTTGSYMGVWKAGPGSYRSEGARAEVFVVIEGRGKIWLQGYGEHALEPGVVITTPAATPAVLTVTEPLRKVSWVDVSKCPIGIAEAKNC
jgi:uncharacterized cupin superfamily protein